MLHTTRIEIGSFIFTDTLSLTIVQIVYYDGQFDDARLAVALACTAAMAGAAVVNHAPAVGLIKDADGKVVGARVK